VAHKKVAARKKAGAVYRAVRAQCEAILAYGEVIERKCTPPIKSARNVERSHSIK
jgi:hypothetical protein